jgi:hypothetical protein
MDYYYYHNDSYHKSNVISIGDKPSYAVSPYSPYRMPIYPNLLVNIDMNHYEHGSGGSVKINTAILVKNNFGLKKAYVQMSDVYIISPATDMNVTSDMINDIINRLKQRIEEMAKNIRIDSLEKTQRVTYK